MLNTESQIQYSAILDFIYPVGSYFITESANYDTIEKVQAHFGGTWVKLNDRFLYATSGTDVGAVGGEANHTLTINEMPSHTHTTAWNSMIWNDGGGNIKNPGSGTKMISASTDCSYTGGGQAHNNMPPYRKVYMYRRTA